MCYCDLLRSVLELSTCLCDFSFFKKKTVLKIQCNLESNHSEVDARQKKAQKSTGSAKMDLQFAAYQIFSSIWVEGYGKGSETTIAGIFSSCYIVLVVCKLSKCHSSEIYPASRLTLDHNRARLRTRNRMANRRDETAPLHQTASARASDFKGEPTRRPTSFPGSSLDLSRGRERTLETRLLAG